MANRFVLNETSYHGKGAINEIATEVKGRGFKKCFVCSETWSILNRYVFNFVDIINSYNAFYFFK